MIKESTSELKNIRSKQTLFSYQKRINCLLFLKESRFATRQELADYLSIHIRTQERWIVKYEQGGIDLLLSDKVKTRTSKLITKRMHDDLEKKVKSENNSFLGYWDAQKWVFEKYNIEINYHTLRHYLITHFKTKLKVPRKSHYKKGEMAVETFLKPS